MPSYWRETSQPAKFLESQRSLRSMRETFGPRYIGGAIRYRDEDLERVDAAISELQNVRARVIHNGILYNQVNELLAFVQALRNDLPMQSPDLAFEKLQPLRKWLIWLPTKILRDYEHEVTALAILAQFCSTALVLESLFPEIEGSYLGCMALSPIEEIDRILTARMTAPQYLPEAHLATELMEFPRHVANEYKSYTQWSQHVPTTIDHYGAATPPSPYPHLQDFAVTTATSSSFTASIHSPSTVTLPPSPYQNIYPPHTTTGVSAVYSGSPITSDYGDEHLSDYSYPGTLEQQSPGFSAAHAPYGGDEYHGLPAAETPNTMSMELLQHDQPLISMNPVAPQLWT